MDYRLNNGITVEKLDDGTSFLVSTETGKIFMLNNMGYGIIEKIRCGLSTEEIINSVFREYNVEYLTAREDILRFLKVLEGEGHIIQC